jgi:large subunit ribosomal protein L17
MAAPTRTMKKRSTASSSKRSRTPAAAGVRKVLIGKGFTMRHRVAGYKLGRNTSHRRALLRNLVTSLIMEERIETTTAKAKAMKPLVEKMITLGKKGDLSARRLAAGYLLTDAAVKRLFDTVGPRFGDRNGGYTRIVRTGVRRGDGGETVFIEILGNEKVLAAKRKKSADARAKRVEEARKQLEADNKAIEAESEKEK